MKVKELYSKFNIEKNSDVEFALSRILDKPRSTLSFCEISKKQIKEFLKIYSQLKKGKPLDLILKQSEFYGFEFYVNKNVLKPRQDTEFVCEKAIEIINSKMQVLDLCCGSGVIGITIAKKTRCQMDFCDVSSKALMVCKKNVKMHNIEATIIKSNLFKKIDKKYDVIISNPPYIETEEIKNLNKNVKNYDPRLALDGGKDGLDFYKSILKEASKFLKDEGKLIFEIGYNQKQNVMKLMEKDFDVESFIDYHDNDRVLIGVKKWKSQKK